MDLLEQESLSNSQNVNNTIIFLYKGLSPDGLFFWKKLWIRMLLELGVHGSII
jgi:hypothetical protein